MATAKYGGNVEKCLQCEKSVYPMERFSREGATYHKECFKCTHCNSQLTLTGFAMINSKPYCKPHYKQLFKEAGGRYEVFGKFGESGGKESPSPGGVSSSSPSHAGASASGPFASPKNSPSPPMPPAAVVSPPSPPALGPPAASSPLHANLVAGSPALSIACRAGA